VLVFTFDGEKCLLLPLVGEFDPAGDQRLQPGRGMKAAEGLVKLDELVDERHALLNGCQLESEVLLRLNLP
jgi:hypothetical protein